jgi:hypothetical protein
MRKVTIDRKKWLRGYNGGSSSSLWKISKQAGCCLGHVCSQLTNTPIEKYSGIAYPDKDLSTKLFPSSRIPYEVSFDIAQINDGVNPRGKVRENKLKAEFAKYDIEVEFYN